VPNRQWVRNTLTGRKIFERFRTTGPLIVMLNPLRTMMGAGRTNRTRSRNAKSRRRRPGSAKVSGKLRPLMINNEETTDVEQTPSLLVSSLKYWEVERNLIDERLAAIRERQQRRHSPLEATPEM
jgi:hypothetical protein